MLIDCDSCAVRNLACGDCVVTVLLGMPAPAAETTGRRAATGTDDQSAPYGENSHDSANEHVPVTRVELDNPERAAIAVLAAHGLVPPLRLVPKDDGGPREEEPGDGAQAAAG